MNGNANGNPKPSANLRSGITVKGTERASADVAIVGSGAGGAAAAYELASAGLDVIVIEAGPQVRPEEFTQREFDTLKRLYVDQGTQGPADGSISVLQGRMVGGSTVINGEVCFRIPDAVLDHWAAEHGVRGMSPADMEGAFEAVERMIHATPNTGRSLDGGKRIAAGLTKLGIEGKPLVRSVKDCHECCYCFFGCAWGCKQSVDRSYLPAAMAKGARVVSDARVETIRLDGGSATGVLARTAEGQLEVQARAVVLACGSIETPLMLIDHALGGAEVGKHLALQPVVSVVGWYDDEQIEYRNAMLSRYSDAFARDGFVIEFFGASPAFVAPFAPGFGAEHKQAARDLAHTSGAAALVRDDRAAGRVRRGRKGEKIIDYALGAQSRERVRRALKTLAEIGLASGARRVTVPPLTAPIELRSTADLRRLDDLPLGPADIAFTSYHPQGTARLGVVTDFDGAVRGTRNLYVMDASVFPSPVGVNTQVPVMGVSTVLARRLADRLRAGSAAS
jgi:choline dehydrogenase-like flavoprotein